MNMIKKTYKQIHDSKTGKVSDKWESYLGFYEELFKGPSSFSVEYNIHNWRQ
jgi:hypothetical protein